MQNASLMGGAGDKKICLEAAVANRHGLPGAQGISRTAALQLPAESFSRPGGPVLAPDVGSSLGRRVARAILGLISGRR